MRKNNIFTFIDEVEKNDETLKKWGDYYRIEESIIETIVKTRKNKGLSQKQVAELTGLKQPAIARIENNANSPQLDTLIKIVDALGLKIEVKDVKENEIQEALDKVTIIADELFDAFYTKAHSFTQNSDIYRYQGGNTSENKSYEHPCQKNHPAW